MIDWKNGQVFVLSECPIAEVMADVAPMLTPTEVVLATFKAFRDCLVITTKRFIAMNAEGLTGKRRSYTTLPYHMMVLFAVRTPSSLDISAEIEIDFSFAEADYLPGKVLFKIKGPCDVVGLSAKVAQYSI